MTKAFGGGWQLEPCSSRRGNLRGSENEDEEHGSCGEDDDDDDDDDHDDDDKVE